MVRLTNSAQIEALRRQQVELAKKIKEAEIKARGKARADDQRRHEVAGRVLLAHVAANPDSEFARVAGDVLDREVTRPGERSLFPGLTAGEDAPPAPVPETPDGGGTDSLPAAAPVLRFGKKGKTKSADESGDGSGAAGED